MSIGSFQLWPQAPGGSIIEPVRPTDPRLSFNQVPDIYDEIRPTYPPELFEQLFEMLPAAPEVIEVGPGTGQATKDLLARGASVHAVEIGPATATKLRTKLDSDRLQITVGDFEHIALAPASADAVFSASAYHWISPAAQTGRPASILRVGGVVAIVDLIQVSSPVDCGFFETAQPIYQRYGEQRPGPPAPTREHVDPAIRKVLEDDGRFERVRVRQWDWDQTYRASDYRKLMISYSGTQMMGEADRVRLLDDIESFIIDRYDGMITRPLVATLTTAVLSGARS